MTIGTVPLALEEEEDPRARLAGRGPGALTDAELVGVVLGAHLRGGDGMGRARALLSAAGGLAGLAGCGAVEIARLAAVGARPAAALCASFELARRLFTQPGELRPSVRGSTDLHAHLRGRFEGLEQERFHVVLLDGKGRVRADRQVSVGTLTASLVHPREVFRPAIRESAAAVALVHNHPSGDPTPSPEDVALTARLRSAGELLGIRVLDHLVIGSGGRYFSFVDSGRF